MDGWIIVMDDRVVQCVDFKVITLSQGFTIAWNILRVDVTAHRRHIFLCSV